MPGHRRQAPPPFGPCSPLPPVTWMVNIRVLALSDGWET